MSVNVLSLFAGIGGLELGLERAGMTVVGQVEIDPFCQRVLAHHWPNVPRHNDVRTTPSWWTSEPRPDVHVLAGGFPCQPFSTAGARKGIADERWGWPWMLDVIDAVRPRHILIENVAALLRDTEAFSIILGDLSDRRFDVEWDVVSACSLGAPHPRRRLFLVAHADSVNGQAGLGTWPELQQPGQSRGARSGREFRSRQSAWRDRVDRALETASSDGRDTDGLSGPMVAALGNAVVPQVSEFIGQRIMAALEVAA